MAFSFKKFAAKQDVTRPYELLAVSEDPTKPIVLVVKHAGDGNPGYMNHSFKRANRGRSRTGQITQELVQTALAEAVDAFSKHVIVGWDNVLEDGKPCPFSVDACKRFLEALVHPTDGRSDVFLELRTFCERPENFRDAVDAGDLGKG